MAHHDPEQKAHGELVVTVGTASRVEANDDYEGWLAADFYLAAGIFRHKNDVDHPSIPIYLGHIFWHMTTHITMEHVPYQAIVHVTLRSNKIL